MHRQIDNDTAEYIRSNTDGDYRAVLAADGRREICERLGDIVLGQVAWVPFAGGTVLQINSNFGAVTGYLCDKCSSVTVMESEPLIAESVRTRWKQKDNLTVKCQESFWEKNVSEYQNEFDYIIYSISETQSFISDKGEYIRRLKILSGYLKLSGVLILTVPNRQGSRYLCGASFSMSGVPFSGITDHEAYGYIPDRQEITEILRKAEFQKLKFHYPYPDGQIVRMLYSDEYKPGKEILERSPSLTYDSSTYILDETELLGQFAKNGDITPFCNDFIIECSKAENVRITVEYATISAGRAKDRSFVTEILSDCRVIKRPVFKEGKKRLVQMYQNALELADRDIPVLTATIRNDVVTMRYVKKRTLSEFIRILTINGKKEELLQIFDQLYQFILQSSDHVNKDEHRIVLKKAYLEMIPVNCFWDNGRILFFDQEYTQDDCPAGFVMFRAINDSYGFIQELDKVITLQEILSRYHLTEDIQEYQLREAEFERTLSQENVYGALYAWEHTDEKTLENHRRMLQMADSKIRLFDPIFGLGNRKLILFGAGRMSDHFRNYYGEDYRPDMILDNASEKWGTDKKGIRICSPDIVLNMGSDTYRIVITVGNYEPIVRQLQGMGIEQENYRIYIRSFCEEYIPYVMTERTMSDGKYNIGYVTGVFDLFHIGHLNVLRNSKERCHYLIAGVLTDELAAQDKGARPIVPYEERAEIVRQCRYVDRVIPVNFHNTDKLIAWKELHYGCLFSGSDHQNEAYWMHIQQQLRSVGSELEFFPYTQQTSSTLLQRKLRGESNKEAVNGKKFPAAQNISILLGKQTNIEKPKNEILMIKTAGFNSAAVDLAAIVPEEMLERTLLNEEKKENESYGEKVFRNVIENPEHLWQFAEAIDRYLKLAQMKVQLIKAPRLKAGLDMAELDDLIYKMSRQSICIADRMDCHALVIPQFSGSNTDQKYRMLAKEAEKSDILLLFENECREFHGRYIRGSMSEPEKAAEFINSLNAQTDGNRFGLCLDTAALTVTGQNPYEYIIAMKDLIKAVRLRDSSSTSPGSAIPFGNTEKGSRTTDWRNILRGLRQIGYSGIVFMDIEETISAYPYILRDEVLQLAVRTAGYIEWQIGLERRIRRYKQVVLFGAGRMCANYMENYGEKYPPLFTCDNNSSLWDTKVSGLMVKNPDALKELPKDTGVFICNMYYEEICHQLEDMGIQNIEYYNDEFSDVYPGRSRYR